ncbi:hypothetical protein H632_c466p0 [Helicosporidium sp. ATCC 50920]|nr:hypothetical protein H632_c466p0 [Helicosporidium sp. ATCC 50920]|eukprot:KDD75860.1 hypothetical protein H632_c466p0 [Helicosporidium sp. ATCC 50920]
MNEMNNDAQELDGSKDLEVYRKQVGMMQSSKVNWARRMKNEDARMVPHRVNGRTIRAHNRLTQPMRIQH